MLKKILVLAFALIPCLFTISTVYAAEDSQSVPVVYHVNPVVTIKDWDTTSTVRLETGQKIREPSHIDKNGYRFLGWRDARTGAYWNFNNEINENITIIAEYEKLVIVDETPVPAQTNATESEGLNTGGLCRRNRFNPSRRISPDCSYRKYYFQKDGSYEKG